jgi:hypothetical protein
VDLEGIGWYSVGQIHLADVRDTWPVLVNLVMTGGYTAVFEFLTRVLPKV